MKDRSHTTHTFSLAINSGSGLHLL